MKSKFKKIKAYFQKFLYNNFNRRPKYPCGRGKKDKHLSCLQPLPQSPQEVNCLITFREKFVDAYFYCPCCGAIIGLSSVTKKRYEQEWNNDESYLFNQWRKF